MEEKEIKKLFSKDRFANELGMELISSTPGYAKTSLKIEERHLNAANVAHGGAIFSLADLAFAIASNSRGRVALSIQASISYIKAVKGGRIFAEAKEISLGDKLAHYLIEITDDSNEKIAVMNGTVYRKKETINEVLNKS